MARLERSLGEIRIAMPMPRAALLHVLHEVARRNRLRDGLLYMQVFAWRQPAGARFSHPAHPPGAGRDRAPTRSHTRRDVANWAGTAVTQPDQRWAPV